MQKKNKKKKNWKKDWKTKHSRAAIALLAGFFALCSGCAQKPDVQMSGVAFEEADTAAGADADEKNAEVQGEENASVLQGSPGSFERNKAAERAVPGSAEPASEEEMSQTERIIYVHVCGAVQHPGVYPMAEGTRVYEAVALAGGFLPEADEQWLNQAAVIGDAQKLYVYSKEETRQMEAEPLRNSWTGGEEAAQNPGTAGDADVSLSDGGDLVDLNTASKEELMTLPGIGEAKAEAILQYRSEHGGFSDVQELLQISGIKEGVFSRIKDRITVR